MEKKSKDEKIVKEVEKKEEKLFGNCTHVYLDVGSNVGVQIRKLYEPKKYPGAGILPYFEKYFPNAANNEDSLICAIGFEANFKHVETLKDIQKCYQSLGWNAYFFAPRAVSVIDGQNLTFYTDPTQVKEGEGNNDYGASLQHHTESFIGRTVKSLDLVPFIKNELPNLKFAFMKMDIEGSEYSVLKHLVEHQILCQNYIAEAILEFHPWPGFASEEEQKIDVAYLEKHSNCGEFNMTKIINLDDESYLFDGKPLPCHDM